MEKYTFKFTPQKKTFGNPDNDYKIYSGISSSSGVKLTSYDKVSIKGNIYELPINVEHTVVGIEEFSQKYGHSYKIVSIERDIPNDEDSTRAFLTEILTKNQADVLIDVYPDIVDRVMEDRLNDIDLGKMKGIKEFTFNNIKSKIIENFAISRAIIEFGGLIDFGTLKKLYDKYGSSKMIKNKLSTEPYETLCNLSRVAFVTADGIMLQLEKRSMQMMAKGKVPPLKFKSSLKTSQDRMRSAIQFVLSNNEKNDQNTRMLLKNLKNDVNRLAPEAMPHFAKCIKASLDVLNIDSKGFVSRISVYNKAVYIAGKLTEALENPTQWDMNPDNFRMTSEGDLTDEQFSLLQDFPNESVHILRGSGGTGKSFTTQMLIRMAEHYKKSILLLAPTGRASKVISKYCSMPASTVHRGLGYNGDWQLNHFQNICEDIVILDESSMGDLDLMYRLISAIDFTRTKLLFIGDPDQLPSVGAGNVYHDLIESKRILVTMLTLVFRYGIGGIDTVCTKIRKGEMYIPIDLKKPMIIGKDKSFMFLPASKGNMLKTISMLYKSLILRGSKPEDILVLSSYNKGEFGTRKLNEVLQKIANSENMNDVYIASTEREKENQTKYYKDDLIMQTANNYKGKKFTSFYEFEDDFYPPIFIPNGDIGKLTEINRSQTSCCIEFDEKVLYNKGSLNSCMLAYSISIHKSQGGQAKNVILVTPNAHLFMLDSNILYVGASRAESNLFQIGEPKSLPAILRKKANLKRETSLQDLLKKSNRDKLLKKYHEIVKNMIKINNINVKLELSTEEIGDVLDEVYKNEPKGKLLINDKEVTEGDWDDEIPF